MIDNINKKNTKYTLNEVIENTIQAPSDRQVIIDNAVKAMEELGIEPVIIPVRGGVDGAEITFKGLPCPNLFTGGR